MCPSVTSSARPFCARRAAQFPTPRAGQPTAGDTIPQPAGACCGQLSKTFSFPKKPRRATLARLPALPQPPSVPGTPSPSRAVEGCIQPVIPKGKPMPRLPSLKARHTLERQEMALKPQETAWAKARCHLVPRHPGWEGRSTREDVGEHLRSLGAGPTAGRGETGWKA